MLYSGHYTEQEVRMLRAWLKRHGDAPLSLKRVTRLARSMYRPASGVLGKLYRLRDDTENDQAHFRACSEAEGS